MFVILRKLVCDYEDGHCLLYSLCCSFFKINVSSLKLNRRKHYTESQSKQKERDKKIQVDLLSFVCSLYLLKSYNSFVLHFFTLISFLICNYLQIVFFLQGIESLFTETLRAYSPVVRYLLLNRAPIRLPYNINLITSFLIHVLIPMPCPQCKRFILHLHNVVTYPL